jgi:hypothetical protein
MTRSGQSYSINEAEATPIPLVPAASAAASVRLRMTRVLVHRTAQVHTSTPQYMYTALLRQQVGPWHTEQIRLRETCVHPPHRVPQHSQPQAFVCQRDSKWPIEKKWPLRKPGLACLGLALQRKELNLNSCEWSRPVGGGWGGSSQYATLCCAVLC